MSFIVSGSCGHIYLIKKLLKILSPLSFKIKIDIALFMTSRCPLLKFSAVIIYRFFLVTLFGITLNQGNLWQKLYLLFQMQYKCSELWSLHKEGNIFVCSVRPQLMKLKNSIIKFVKSREEYFKNIWFLVISKCLFTFKCSKLYLTLWSDRLSNVAYVLLVVVPLFILNLKDIKRSWYISSKP